MEKSKKQLKEFESEIRPNSEFLGLFREELINMAERDNHHHKKKDKLSSQYTKKSQIEKTTRLGISDSESNTNSDTDSSFSSKDVPAQLIKPVQSNQLIKPVKSGKSTVQSIRPVKQTVNPDSKDIKQMDIKINEKSKPDIQVVSSSKPVKELDDSLDSGSKIRMLNNDLDKNISKEKIESTILDKLELSEYEMTKLKELVKYFVDIKG